MSAFRPLPPRPSLEYEHKEAKALLRRLHAGDPDSIARAKARLTDVGDPASLQLADAQLTIAREYGFASWPKLVRYFEDLERQRHRYQGDRPHGRRFYESWVQTMLAEHRDRRVWTARALTAYVPRFYGMRVKDVLSAAIDEPDARIAVARIYGHPSWDAVVEQPDGPREKAGGWDHEPMQQASRAMEAGDLERLKRIVEQYPQLLHRSDTDVVKNYTLFSAALWAERKAGANALRPIMEWLTEQGLDKQRELNLRLCGHMGMSVDEVRQLLDWGADPNWVAPNGIPVLEHALIRHRNGAAVDLIAARTKPRKALWIAAGLGDVDGVRAFLDTHGRPTQAARELRPDFAAVGPLITAQHPEPDDEEILVEAFVIAMGNGRVPVLQYMLGRGFPVNTLIWGMPLVLMAVSDLARHQGVAECLINGGADLDLRGWRPQESAREFAREMLENNPDRPEVRRIAELCGLDVAAVLAERDARPAPEPVALQSLKEALTFAGDDAFRMGQTEIRPENLFFGILRWGSGGLLPMVTRSAGVEAERFSADVRARVRPDEPSPARPQLVLDADSQEMMRIAITRAKEKRREAVGQHHLLYALTRADTGAVAEYLARYGTSAGIVNAELQQRWEV